MKQILLLTMFVLLLSSIVTADDRYGAFPINNEYCIIIEESNINETNESIEVQKSRGSGGYCEHEWVCGEWDPCNSRGYQTRQCEDKWSCPEIRKLPELYRECETESNVVIEVEEIIYSNQEEIINVPEQQQINNNNAITGAVVGGKPTTWLWILIPIGLAGFMLILAYKKRSN